MTRGANIKVNSGTKVTTDKDPVTVTAPANVNAFRWAPFDNAIAIEFTGLECHVIQIAKRIRWLNGQYSSGFIATDEGGNPENWNEWLVDTNNAHSPYYDMGQAAEQKGNEYKMMDAPTMDLPGLNPDPMALTGVNDYTLFVAYSFCLRNKELIAIVHWSQMQRFNQAKWPPYAEIVGSDDWDDTVKLGRRVLTGRGFDADLYLPWSSWADCNWPF